MDEETAACFSYLNLHSRCLSSTSPCWHLDVCHPKSSEFKSLLATKLKLAPPLFQFLSFKRSSLAHSEGLCALILHLHLHPHAWPLGSHFLCVDQHEIQTI